MSSKAKRNFKKSKKLSAPMKKAIKNLIVKNIRPEIKYTSFALGTNAGPIVCNTNFTPLQLDSLLTQSAGNSTDITRIGDQIKIHRLEMRLQLSGQSNYSGGTVRITIFQWHGDNSIDVPTATDLFNAGVSALPDSMPMRNEDHKRGGQCSFLYDKSFSLNGGGATGNGDRYIKNLKVNVPLKYAKKVISYKTGTPDGFETIWACILADRAPAGTDQVQLVGQTRLHFTDS